MSAAGFLRDFDATSTGVDDATEEQACFQWLLVAAPMGTSARGAASMGEVIPWRAVSLTGTSPGIFEPHSTPPWQTALQEIRHRSALTWGQLAQVFGVNRRSVHFWARGERPNAVNAQRIMAVLYVVRRIDTTDPDTARSLLLRPHRDGESVFDLLCAGEDSRAARALAQPEPATTAVPSRRRRPPPLSASERLKRRGLGPADLLEARHDAPPPKLRPLGTMMIPGARVGG